MPINRPFGVGQQPSSNRVNEILLYYSVNSCCVAIFNVDTYLKVQLWCLSKHCLLKIITDHGYSVTAVKIVRIQNERHQENILVLSGSWKPEIRHGIGRLSFYVIQLVYKNATIKEVKYSISICNNLRIHYGGEVDFGATYGVKTGQFTWHTVAS